MITTDIVKELDLFYTKPLVAKKCYSKAKAILKNYINENTLWIEPSAGSGSFFNILEGDKLGFDIHPQTKNIKKLDFIESDITLNKNDIKRSIVIGNPPFGRRAKKAIDFFNKAASLSDFICFIVPNQFCKYSVQSRLNKDFRLIYEHRLDDNSFTANGKDYKALCIFQIWTRAETKHKDLRIKTSPPITHKDFEIFQYNNTKEALKYFDKEKYGWDFAVPRQGFYDYSKRVTNADELNTKVQWAFFKSSNKKVLKRLRNIDFEKLARKNTVILGFGKHDVVKEYMDLYEKDISKNPKQ